MRSTAYAAKTRDGRGYPWELLEVRAIMAAYILEDARCIIHTYSINFSVTVI